MSDVRLLFGRPKIREKEAFLAALREVQNRHGCVIQAIDASMVVSERHASFAAEKAMLAFSEKRNVAKDLGLEILRYASGQRQIERALSMGVSEATERVALIVMENGTAPEISDIIEADDDGPHFIPATVKKVFEIGNAEIEAAGEERIPDLVLERVALIDAYR
ncbi:MAG TPA: KEOPS complex subunit Cgi121 [Methanothrix sp.]|nr:KEOPS complex subunit Cgi121 [Methanothrix sp.]HPJ84030.1 KEOPS complex subunit Cgi121 [Methanothrix sp.]HPR67587.1 KEOPS complex subunit Cgi121 [Methanothrix sp.]